MHPEKQKHDFEPKIIAFVCTWCTYAGADLAGTSRMQYPANVRVLKFPCTGRIDPVFILKAFQQGADGVLVSGCHPGRLPLHRRQLPRPPPIRRLPETAGIRRCRPEPPAVLLGLRRRRGQMGRSGHRPDRKGARHGTDDRVQGTGAGRTVVRQRSTHRN